MIRWLVILAGIALFFSIEDPHGQAGAADASEISDVMYEDPAGVSDFVHVVSETSDDVMGLCDRKPDVCAKTERLMQTVRRRAASWARLIHDWLSEEPMPEPQEERPQDGRGDSAHALAQK